MFQKRYRQLTVVDVLVEEGHLTRAQVQQAYADLVRDVGDSRSLRGKLSIRAFEIHSVLPISAVHVIAHYTRCACFLPLSLISAGSVAGPSTKSRLDGAKALMLLKDLTEFGQRYPGAPKRDKAIEKQAAFLRRTGATVELQKFHDVSNRWKVLSICEYYRKVSSATP